jgi:NAD(P)-dependent dehydrogenase (short-subunit alcohol dehydrogenase family)
MFDLQLTGKVAVITGGSDGLGKASALRLAQEGCRVAICARRDDHLEIAAGDIRDASGAEVLAIPADVTNVTDVENFFAAIMRQFGGVDILVNNAGRSAAASFEKVDDADWMADLELKVLGAVRCCRLAIPSMRARGGGSIINAAIVGGKAPAAAALPTTVSRAAGINLTKALANEYAGDNIRVNAICIGLLKSAQWERRATGAALVKLYQDLGQRVPLGRVGEAEDYADLVAFLASARAAYITGTAINLDGGMSAAV